MRKMRREFNVLIEKDEDGYFVATVLALPGCHTQFKQLDVPMKRVQYKKGINLYCREEVGITMKNLHAKNSSTHIT